MEVTERMVYSDYTKQRIVFHHSQNLTASAILLDTESIVTTCQGVARFLKIYRETGTISRRHGSGRKPKVSTDVKRIVEEQVRKDNETTAVHLHHILTLKGFTLPEHDPTMPKVAWVDVPQQHVLPVDQRRE